MEELNDNFHFVYSCSLMHRIQIKIGTLEGNRQKPEYDKLLEDPLLKYSGLCQDGYADLKVECVVYDAGQPLALPVTTSHKGFSSRWSWNEWLTLPIQYSDLPRTAQLALTIYDCVGPDKMYPVGGTTIRLFSKHGLFRQGMVDLRVFPNRKADGSDKTETPGKTKDNGKDQRQRLTKLTKKHRNSHMTKVDWLDRLAFRELGQIIAAEKDASEYMYLMIEFPKLYIDSIEHHVVYFEQSGEELFSFRSHTDIVTVPDQEILRENLVERKHHKLARSLRSGHCDKDAKPNATIRDILNTIVSYPSTKPLSNEEQDHVWKFRFYLSNQKKALTKFLKCVNWTQQNEVRQALAMMKIWAPMDVEDALELLSPNFTHPAVRRYAISRLQKASDEDIFLYMLQLVQALKYESFKDIQEAYARISPGREQPLSSAALITLNEEKEREAATLAAAAAAAAAANATQASQQQTGSPHLEKKDSKESNTSTMTNESQQFAMHRSSTSSNFSYNSYGTTTTGSNNNLNQTVVSSSASPVGGLNSDRTSSNVNSVIENYGRRESGGGDLSDGDLLPMSTTRGSTTSLPQLSMAAVTDTNDTNNTTTALPNLIGRNNNAYTDSGNTETLQDYVNNDIINEEEDENVQDLATFLIYRACKNSSLANYFYWYLSIECEDQEPTIKENVVVREMYMTVMKTFSQALVKGTPEMQKRRVFLSQQQHFINNLVKLVKNVLRESGNRKKKAEKLQQLLSDPSAKYNFSSFEPFPFPLDPDVTIKGIIPEKASLFKSALMPSKLHFVTSDNTEYLAIFKHGDDLRQDQLILQMITLMDRLLRKENLDLKLTPYRVLATSTKHGFVQFIDSVSVAEAVAAEGSIHNYFRKHHPQETGPYGIAPDIMDTYVRSCAGYCVITYLLGVGDRHLDNLLLTPCGKLFHIDFGYILGRDPKPLPPPMKLSKEMVEAMGGVNSEHYQEFRKQCYTAFLHLRRHANLMLNLFSLMVDASVPDIALEPDKAVRKVQDKFRLDLGEEEAVHYIQYLIDSSVTAVMPAIVEQIHKFTQYIRK